MVGYANFPAGGRHHFAISTAKDPWGPWTELRPILADVEKESAVSYGVLGKFLMMTITKRESFIIDPEGVIVKHYKSVDPEKHTDEVIEELKLLQKRA